MLKADNITSIAIRHSFLAILDNHTDLVQLLLEHGINPNDGTNPSLLYYAITSTWTSPSIIQALLRAGAHVNHQTLDGWTPVMHAAAHRYHGPLGDRKTVIRLLLQYGAAIPTPEQYNLLLERDRRALAQEIAKWQKEANLQAQQEQRLN